MWPAQSVCCYSYVCFQSWPLGTALHCRGPHLPASLRCPCSSLQRTTSPSVPQLPVVVRVGLRPPALFSTYFSISTGFILVSLFLLCFEDLFCAHECKCVGAHTLLSTCGDQRTTYRRQFSPSTTWGLGVLTAGALISWAHLTNLIFPPSI